jgi:hypothetical protein
MAVRTYHGLCGQWSGGLCYISLIQLLTQPTFECTLTVRSSGCTRTIRAAGCTLQQTGQLDGCTLMVGAARHCLVGAGGVLGL